MDKIFNLLPKAILSAYLIKMITFSPSVTDVGVIACVCGVVGIQYFLDKKKSIQEVQENCFKQIEEIKSAVNKQIEVITTMSVEVAKVKQDMMGVKLKSGFTETGVNPLTGRKVG